MAIIIGAVIALVKFQLLGPLAKKLEPEITSGSVGVRHGKIYLHAEATVKNAALWPVTIDPDYTGLRLGMYKDETHDWELVETYGIFEEEIKLVANAVEGQPIWIVRDEEDALALRLELVIGSVDLKVWRAVAIVNLVGEVHNRIEEQHKGRLERVAQWLSSKASKVYGSLTDQNPGT